MKKYFALTAFAALAASAALPAMAETSVGVSIGINEPGVYGRVEFNSAEPPALVYSQPVVIQRDRYAWRRDPVYLYVPAEQTRHWARYCGNYGACGQPVYFVQEQWVRNRYEAAHRGGWRDHDRRDWNRDRRGWHDNRRDWDDNHRH